MIDRLKVKEFIDSNHTVKTVSEDIPLSNKIAHYSPDPLSANEKYELKVTRELLLKMH